MRDRGVQPERTALAWRRTALAMAGNGLLLVRAGAASHSRGVITASVLVLVAAIVMFSAGAYRKRALLQNAPVRGPHALLALCIVFAVWLAGTAAIAVMLS